MNVAENMLPIKTAYTGVSCVNCMETRDNLLTCAKCKRVKYCGRDCQRADWRRIHKHECAVLKSFQETYNTLAPGGTLLQKTAAYKVVMELTAPEVAKQYSDRYLRFLQYARSCCVCGKNDFELLADDAEWMKCETCKYGWCCSQEHYKEYRSKHTQEICDTYVNATAVRHFLWRHAKMHNETFLFVPETGRTVEMEQFPTSWDEYFQLRCPDVLVHSQQNHIPSEFLPASTMELSQPLTCLYAMHLHGIDDFKDKKSLTIHVVGASFSYEIIPSCVWEEILHCLPRVKSLHMIFVGPEALSRFVPPITEHEVEDAGCCPACLSQNRTRSTSLFSMTYHDFQASPKFATPDLVVAFNSGLYEEYTESWKTSLKVMIEMDVPALFTSYNKYEAEQDIAVISSVNANLLTKEPVLNPMRVAFADIEACGQVDAFFHINMYCNAFKGHAE